MDCIPPYIDIHILVALLNDTLFVLKKHLRNSKLPGHDAQQIFTCMLYSLVSHRLHATCPFLLYELILTQLMSVIKIVSYDGKLNHIFHLFFNESKIKYLVVFDTLEVGYGQWFSYILYISSLLCILFLNKTICFENFQKK